MQLIAYEIRCLMPVVRSTRTRVIWSLEIWGERVFWRLKNSIKRRLFSSSNLFIALVLCMHWFSHAWKDCWTLDFIKSAESGGNNLNPHEVACWFQESFVVLTNSETIDDIILLCFSITFKSFKKNEELLIDKSFLKTEIERFVEERKKENERKKKKIGFWNYTEHRSIFHV